MSTLNQAIFKDYARTYEVANEELHNFSRPHIVKWIELLSLKGEFWADFSDDPDAFRYSELDKSYAYFDSEYYTLSIPLPFFDDPEPFFEEERAKIEEKERRKSLEAEDVRRKRIAELERLLAEDAPPTELDKELTRKYH